MKGGVHKAMLGTSIGLAAAMMGAAGSKLTAAFGKMAKKVASHEDLHKSARAYNPYGGKQSGNWSVAADKRRAKKARNVKMNRRAHRG